MGHPSPAHHLSPLLLLEGLLLLPHPMGQAFRVIGAGLSEANDHTLDCSLPRSILQGPEDLRHPLAGERKSALWTRLPKVLFDVENSERNVTGLVAGNERARRDRYPSPSSELWRTAS